MQPYFMPYIGYFQLIDAVDLFVLYDNIKHTKKGWINRNRYLRHGEAALFSLPLASDSDALDVRDRRISASFDKPRLLRRLAQAYRQAPMFPRVFPMLEAVVLRDEPNLFKFIHHSLTTLLDYLGVATRITVSSSIPIDHSLRHQDKVLALCRQVGARTYVNAIGGRELYSPDYFGAQGLALKYLRSSPIEYPQLRRAFVPQLSIIDVLMFNSREQTRAYVQGHYELV